MLVGGSALYTRAVLDRFEFPGTDAEVRARWEAELERVGAPALHARLAEADPAAALAVLPSNGRRIVRALEVIELTGRPFSATLPVKEYVDAATVQVGLDAPRATVDERVDAARGPDVGGGTARRGPRAGGAGGCARGPRPGGPSATGRRWTTSTGPSRAEEARAATAQATRRFARRQESWFRKDERVAWLPHDAADLVERAVGLVRGRVGGA